RIGDTQTVRPGDVPVDAEVPGADLLLADARGRGGEARRNLVFLTLPHAADFHRAPRVGSRNTVRTVAHRLRNGRRGERAEAHVLVLLEEQTDAERAGVIRAGERPLTRFAVAVAARRVGRRRRELDGPEELEAGEDRAVVEQAVHHPVG